MTRERRCSRTCATPTACSRRSTARWKATRSATPGRGADAIGKAVADAVAKQGGGGSSADVPAQIEQLAKLRDDGHITAAEFETKKAELLKKM